MKRDKWTVPTVVLLTRSMKCQAMTRAVEEGHLGTQTVEKGHLEELGLWASYVTMYSKFFQIFTTAYAYDMMTIR
jgi:hypothetical protein